jgi:hypothetical protein
MRPGGLLSTFMMRQANLLSTIHIMQTHSLSQLPNETLVWSNLLKVNHDNLP